MGLFNIFKKKKSIVASNALDNQHDLLLYARIKVVEDFKVILQKRGMDSFQMSVGDNSGNHMDKLILVGKSQYDSNLKEFISASLIKPHTASKLISIGFTEVMVTTEDVKGEVGRLKLQSFTE